MRNKASLKKQAGVVIILAMFMVALMASMAYVLMAQTMRDTKRTELILQDTQATLVASGARLWAKDALTQDWLHQKPAVRVDVMPMHLPPSVVENFRVQAELQDLQAKYNINNLTNEGSGDDFVILLKAVSPSLGEDAARDLTKNITLWLKPVMTNDTLDRYYAELPYPYRAGHRLMADVSELKLVKGMTPAIYAALLPYVTALPAVTTINPQTASAPVLMTLSPTMNASTAAAFILLREQNPVLTKEAFQALPMMANHAINSDKIAMVSSYFLLKTEVSRDDEQWVVYHVLERALVNGRAVVRVISEER